MTSIERSRDRAYWTFQVIGWAAYSAVGLIWASQMIGWRPALTIGYVLYFAYSVALSDLLRREAQRRGWADGPPGRMWTRMLAGGVVIGAIQTVLIVAVNLVLEGSRSPFVDRDQVLYVWMGTTQGTAMWVVYYLIFTAKRNSLGVSSAQLRNCSSSGNP